MLVRSHYTFLCRCQKPAFSSKKPTTVARLLLKSSSSIKSQLFSTIICGLHCWLCIAVCIEPSDVTTTISVFFNCISQLFLAHFSTVFLNCVSQVYFSTLNTHCKLMYCWLSSGPSDTSRSERGMGLAEVRKRIGLVKLNVRNQKAISGMKP